MIYLENSTEEQTIYIPRENTDTQSIKPISPNIPTDVLADYYTKIETNNIFATKEEVNEKVANLQEQIDNGGGGSTSNIVYIYAQWDNNLSEEQWLEIVENYPNKNYKIVLNVQTFEENGKEYKAETIVEVVGVNYEQYPELTDNNGTIYNDCTLGFISGVHNNISYVWSREFGDYGFEMYVREEGIPSRQEVDDLSNTLYETANAIVPKIYYIDKNNLSLEDFNNIKNEVNNSKVILNLGDGQNVEIIKTTDNALYAINCYWVNENDVITYNELSDNGGGSGSGGVVNVYNETNSLGIGITQTTKTKTRKSNLSIDEFDEIMTKLSNNERVILKNIQLNIEIVGFINKPYTEISFMGFSSSTIKGTYLGESETSNLLVKWVKENVDGETIVNIKIYNLSYLYNAIETIQSNSIYTYTETNYSETDPDDIDSSLTSTDFEDIVNRFPTQQVAIYNTNGNFKVNIMTIKDNVLYGYYIKEDDIFGIISYFNGNGDIKYKFEHNIYKFYTTLDFKTDKLKSEIDYLKARITALENK